MKKFFKLSLAVALLILAGTSMISCKKNFDQPPGPSDPNFTANTSIADLKALHTGNGVFDVITSDITISGIVVADDKSGNLYKQLYIQDETGGLQILLDQSSLYATYPVGRKVFIKCQGLCITDYNGTMELGIKATVAGLPSCEAIPAGMIDTYVVGGSLNNPVVPIPVTYSQLGTEMHNKYLGCLIQLDGYEFRDTSATYSDTSAYKSTVNLDIKPCSGPAITVRTSAYANFAGQKVAGGKGSIAAIYTTYNTSFSSTRQLILRDPSDINMTGDRCNLFEEDFEGIGANNLTLNLSGWYNIAEVGGRRYQNGVFGGTPTRCAKITAFGSGQANVTSWLITPPITLIGASVVNPQLTFRNAAFLPSNPLQTGFKVFVSTNYDGSNTPSTSTWTQYPFNVATTSTFVPSGPINLSAYIGQTIYIGWKYEGADPGRTTTFELDDIAISRQ